MKVKYTSSKWFLENNGEWIEIDEKDYRKIEDICIEFELDKENINATIWQYGIDKSYDLPDDVGFEIVYECQEEIMGCKGCSCKKVAHLKVEQKEQPTASISNNAEGVNRTSGFYHPITPQPSKVFRPCNGKISSNGVCEKCYQVAQTSSGYCIRLVESS